MLVLSVRPGMTLQDFKFEEKCVSSIPDKRFTF